MNRRFEPWEKRGSNKKHYTKAKSNVRIAIARENVLSTAGISNESFMDSCLTSFIVDSGATHHICCNSEMFTSMYEEKNLIQLGDERTVKSTHQGTVNLLSDLNGNQIQLRQVFMPHL